MNFRFAATSGVVQAPRPAGKAAPSPIKEIATARRHSRPWLMELVCTMSSISTPDALQGRAGNEISCANCGEPLRPKRGSRRMRFCCDACRQSAFRARKWASRYEGARPLRPVRNTTAGSRTCKGNFGDRGSGVRGPLRVMERELFDSLLWRPVVSPDGVRTEIARLGTVPRDANVRAGIRGT
jgi:hypothetical protein